MKPRYSEQILSSPLALHYVEFPLYFIIIERSLLALQFKYYHGYFLEIQACLVPRHQIALSARQSPHVHYCRASR